jgi:hypothetical protein
MSDLPYTPQQLFALRQALARGERRVTFGDRMIEYRSVDELLAAIHEIESVLAARTQRRPRQLRVTTTKGY